MSKYETIVLFKSSLCDNTINNMVKGIENIIKQNGVLVDSDKWGRRELAYPIQKHKSAYYTLLTFESENSDKTINEIQDYYNGLGKKVLKSIFVKV